MQANQPQGGGAKASTTTSSARTRPAMASKRLDLPSNYKNIAMLLAIKKTSSKY
ncbi:TPA: hypothetical protein ACGJ1D_003310 [Pseudomonas aeruginosa]|uniref:hypothetical protein n=1 Tax=Pseudomonas aeruginosa TaxID=287 RepID=UPI0012986857|nr:hypothetical protein [Pseudomonas aeruginosa]MDV7831889.1 hypothetical protein [Pseudomonas aeruginosa]